MIKIEFESLTIYGIEAGSHLQDVQVDDKPNQAGRNTLRFVNGAIFVDVDVFEGTKNTNLKLLAFKYVSASTGKECEAVFNRDNISGYSLTRK